MSDRRSSSCQRPGGRRGLFQVMLALEPPLREIPGLAGVELDLLAAATATVKFDLTLSLRETAAGLRGELEYKTALYDDSTMARVEQTPVQRPARCDSEILLPKWERGRLKP